MKHGYKNNDFAILYRTNYQSRVFEEALRRKDLAYQLVGGLSFYQRKEIKDVLAYLTLLVNPHDETNLLRIINEPSRGIGNKSIQDLIKQAREEDSSIWNIIQDIEKLDVYKPAKARVREFVDMINRLRSNLKGGESISDTVKALLEQSGYIRALVEENSHESMMRRDNIIELQNAISYYEKGKEKPSLSAFLQEISLITDTDKFDEDKPAITLMTVHASKGLEFPCVFIVGLEENLFPIGARDNFDVDIEEERRLFYVAITRAEERLYFSHCRSRFKFGEETRQARSRFLDEVDAGVVQTETGATISQKKDRSENKSAGDSGMTVDYDWKQSHTKKTYKSPSATIHYDYEDGKDPFQVGTKVMHSKFGPGKIISRSGLGTDAKVIVFFKNRGQKKLMLRAAPLQVID
jgi:DNA helicase-2/ATP-dependent DNA helicase PcrA